MEELDRELGLRHLTAENWLTQDPTTLGAGYFSHFFGPIAPDAVGWARRFLAVELDPEVPSDVRALFKVAQGCMPYGWFFYPLYTLGEEQLFRVLDAAAYHCYSLLGGPTPVPDYFKRIDWLDREKIIPPKDGSRWHAARKLRNSTSHPIRRSVMPPGAVLDQLEAAAWDINAIFRRARVDPRWPSQEDTA